jgi:tRNA(Ile)-lysidine synthase
LRGAESERDEQFVQSLQTKYNKEVRIKKFDTKQYAEENKLSIQEAARELRYKWFEEVVNTQSSMVNSKAAYLLTAHHADDNIETVMMHFFRGTGLHGLTGIPSFDKERKIIRPLLFAKRDEIVAYATNNNLQWVEDSSNASDKYTRNLFRNTLIPALKDVYPDLQQNIMQNIDRFKETEILYQQSVDMHLKNLLEYKGNEVHIPVLKLKKTEPLKTIVWEIIKPFNFSVAQVDEIVKLLDANNAAYVQSSTCRIIKNRNWLIIAPISAEDEHHILIEDGDEKIAFNNHQMRLKKMSIVNHQLSTASNIAVLDASLIQYPLLLRKWKQGDYFYPLGMRKKKKLSKFFIDLKLSPTEKEKVWVIEMDKKIVWVIGYRIDDRFKITPSTQNILEINYQA